MTLMTFKMLSRTLVYFFFLMFLSYIMHLIKNNLSIYEVFTINNKYLKLQ